MPTPAFSLEGDAITAALPTPSVEAIDPPPETTPVAAEPPPPPPTEDALVELGRRLFFDPGASHSKAVVCASCHQPEHGFSDPDA